MKSTEPEPKNDANPLRKNLWPVAKKVAVWIGLVWLFLTTAIGLIWRADAGTVGDTFGAVNALFSGLALAGVVIAILLQSEDLRAQERAMEIQTSEMKGTTAALEAQTKLLDAQVRHSGQQEFDTRFFETVRFIRSSFDRLDVCFPDLNSFRGAAAVSQLSGALRNSMQPKLDPDVFREQFARFERNYGRHYQPALQMLKICLEMLTETPQMTFHGWYLKASCSAEEKWLFCHVFLFSRRHIEPSLKQVIERLSFFEGIDSQIAQTDNLGLEESAFGIGES